MKFLGFDMMSPNKMKLMGVILLLASGVSASENPATYDMFDNAYISIRAFVAQVSASINAASEKHDEIIEQLKTVTADTLNSSTEDFRPFTNNMNSKVAEIRTQETEQNKAQLDNCISQYVDQMQNLLDHIMRSITSCVEALESKTTIQVEASRSDIQDSLYITSELNGDIDRCRYDADSDECIARVVIEILMLTLEIPTNIEEKTRRTGDLVDSYIEQIPVCPGSGLLEANAMSGKISGYFRMCTDSVLNPRTYIPLSEN